MAKGGMAEIFLGKLIGEDGFERVCCFKRILPHFAMEKEFIEMFRDEAHIGKRLQHPNIVRVEGFEEVDGAYAIIMEFINGADLRSVMNACENLKIKIPIPVAVQIIAEAARGLHFAHVKKDEISGRSLGIVHRDISPQNLLLSFEGEVKVTDFGIAAADTKLTETKTGVVKGKFSYMSPEQISGAQVDQRTDVFALGIILWEMLTGRRLFNAENEVMIIQLVRDCLIPEDIKFFNSDIDPDLERIVMKSLKKNLPERYETASAFEKDLRLYQSKFNPGFGADQLGDFLRNLLGERRAILANDIKEMLSNKSVVENTPAVELDLREPTTSHTESGIKSLKDFTNLNKTGSRQHSIGTSPGTRINQPSPLVQGSQKNQQYSQGNQKVSQNQSQDEDSTFGRNSIIAIGALVLVLLVYFLMKPVRQDQGSNPTYITWTITTTPDVAKFSLDGRPLYDGRFKTSPIVLTNLSSGLHRLQVSRPGYSTELIAINLSESKPIEQSEVFLKLVGKMAPLRLMLQSPSSAVQYDFDEGLFTGKLTYDKSLALTSVTFGAEHSLVITLGDNSSFSCKFIPRAQDWTAPFIVSVSPSQRRCFYPAS